MSVLSRARPVDGVLDPRVTDIAAVLRDLNRTLLRIATFLAPALAVVYVALQVGTGDPVYTVLTAGAVAVGAVAAMESRSRDPSVERAIVVSLVAFTAAAPSVPLLVRGAFGGVFVLLAMVGMLVIPRPALVRFVSVVAALSATSLSWPALDIAGWGETAAWVAVIGVCLVVGAVAVLLARHALERSEAIRLEMYRRVPIGLFRTSANTGRVIDANPAMLEMLGFDSLEQLAARAPQDLYVDPSDRAALYRRIAEHGGPQRYAHRLRRADGTPIWVRGYTQEVREHGRIVGYEGIIEDITQRRDAEARFHTLFHRAPIALWEEDFSAVAERLDELRAAGVTDLSAHLSAHPIELDGLVRSIRFVDVNPAGVALLGSADRDSALREVAPRPLPAVVADSFATQFLAIWEGKDQFATELTGHRADGSPTDLAMHWAAAVDEHGPDYGRVVVAISDVSVVKAAERELAGIIRSKDELIASVSHELRTPITTIMGMALELHEHVHAFGEPERSELTALIADQSRELSDIVEDLLVAARADADSLAVRPQVIDAAEEVQRIIATRRGEPADLEVAGRPVLAWADPLRFRQIVRNLLSNAARYGGPLVRVVLERRDRTVHVEVIDDGAGIPEHQRERVFQPYATVDGGGVPGSIGLGLPVSLRLARMMGGDLTYRYAGGCSVFELTVPVPGASAS